MTEIIDQQTMGGSPGAGNGTPAPVPGTLVTIQADPQQEYVAATGTAFYGNYWRTLRWAMDDVTQDFGDDIYERMMRDPQIIACLNTLKTGILEDGPQLRPAVDDADKDGYELAAEIHAACEGMLDEIDPSMDDMLWNMLDGIALGNKVAEIIWGLESTYTGAQQLQISAVKVKPRHSVAFVVDVYNNVIGLLARIPGIGVPVQSGSFILSSVAPYNILPREKFAVLSFRPKDSDPRGTSILRPAYNAWWLKMQTWPQYLKFLVQFGTPSLVGYTSPNSVTLTLPGTAQQTPEQIMLAQLLNFQNGTAAVFAHDAKVDTIDVAGSGVEAFVKAFDLYDRQMTTGILHQTLATMEGEHQARAASETHQSALLTLIRQAKRSVQRMIRRDMLRSWVRFTYGEQAVALTPFVTLGRADKTVAADLMNAIASLERVNYLDPSQLPAIDEMLNLPARSAEDMALRQERHNAPPIAPVAAPFGAGQQPGQPGNKPEEEEKKTPPDGDEEDEGDATKE